jgi:hypothetical protein
VGTTLAFTSRGELNPGYCKTLRGLRVNISIRWRFGFSTNNKAQPLLACGALFLSKAQEKLHLKFSAWNRRPVCYGICVCWLPPRSECFLSRWGRSLPRRRPLRRSLLRPRLSRLPSLRASGETASQLESFQPTARSETGGGFLTLSPPPETLQRKPKERPSHEPGTPGSESRVRNRR